MDEEPSSWAATAPCVTPLPPQQAGMEQQPEFSASTASRPQGVGRSSSKGAFRSKGRVIKRPRRQSFVALNGRSLAPTNSSFLKNAAKKLQGIMDISDLQSLKTASTPGVSASLRRATQKLGIADMDIDDTLLSSNSVMDGRFEGLLNQQLQTRHEEIQRKKDEVNAMHARVKKEARLVKEMEERLLYATRNLDVAKKDADATADGMRNRVLQENIRCAQEQRARFVRYGETLSLMSKRLATRKRDTVCELRAAEGDARKVQKALKEFREKVKAIAQEQHHFDKLVTFMSHKLRYNRQVRGRKLTELKRSILRNKARQSKEEEQARRDTEERKRRMGRRNEKPVKQTVVQQIESTQLANQLTEQDSKIANLKAAFARIKMETGESNIDRIVHKFLTREETHEGILQEIENINERIELANTENQHLKTQLDQSGGISRSGISRSLYKNVDKLQEEVKREKRREEDAMRRATEADCVLQELKHSVKRFLLKVSIVNAPPQPREGHAHLDHVQVAAAHEKDKHVIDAVMGLSIDSSTAESKNTAAEESLRDAAAHLRGKIDKALAFIMAEVGGEGRPSEGDDGAKQGDGDGDSGEVPDAAVSSFLRSGRAGDLLFHSLMSADVTEVAKQNIRINRPGALTASSPSGSLFSSSSADASAGSGATPGGWGKKASKSKKNNAGLQVTFMTEERDTEQEEDENNSARKSKKGEGGSPASIEAEIDAMTQRTAARTDHEEYLFQREMVKNAASDLVQSKTGRKRSVLKGKSKAGKGGKGKSKAGKGGKGKSKAGKGGKGKSKAGKGAK